jgi:hypothetical protein
LDRQGCVSEEHHVADIHDVWVETERTERGRGHRFGLEALGREFEEAGDVMHQRNCELAVFEVSRPIWSSEGIPRARRGGPQFLLSSHILSAEVMSNVGGRFT